MYGLKHQWRRSGVFVDFEHISALFLVFLLLLGTGKYLFSLEVKGILFRGCLVMKGERSKTPLHSMD